MEKQLDNKILKFLWLYLSIFGVVLITIFISITMSGDLQKQEKEFIDYSLNWYTDDGKAATLNNISGEYTIYTILPEIKRGTSLYFNFKTLNVEIFAVKTVYIRHQPLKKDSLDKPPARIL